MFNVGNQLRAMEGCAQLVNVVDRELANRAAEFYSPAQAILLKAVSTGGGAVIGGGIGYLAVIAFIENPSFWALAGSAGIGGVAVGGIAYYFTNRHIQSCKAEADLISTQMKDLVSRTYGIMLAYQETQGVTVPASKIASNKTILMEQGYVNTWNSTSFSFNQQKFDKIKKCYQANAQAEVENTIKFLSLCSVVILPASESPTDSVIENLSKVVGSLSNQAISNYGRILLARAYLNKFDKPKALEQLGKVPSNSDLYEPVQRMIRNIQHG